MRRTPARSLALTTTSLLIAGLLASSLPPMALAADDAAEGAGSNAVAGIETVGPLAVAEAATGELWPSAPPSVGVMPSGSVRSGDFPLIYSAALADKDSVDYRLVDLRTPRRAVVVNARLINGFDTVPVRLDAGGLYEVEIPGSDGGWRSIGRLAVGVQGTSGGAPLEVGGAEVDTVTGTVTSSWSARPLLGPLGETAARLAWTSGMEPSPGLPTGWRLVLGTGSAWASLVEDGQDTEAVDIPAAPRATTRSTQPGKALVRFAYPARERAQVEGFHIAVRTRAGDWRTVKKLGAEFGRLDVNAVIPVTKASRSKVRVGAVATGTVVWGPAVALSGREPRVPLTEGTSGDLAGAGANSLLTTGVLPDTVTLIGWDSTRLNFVRNSLGVYEQIGGTAGFQNALTRVGDSTWEFTDTQGVVTLFRDGMATEVWNNERRMSQVTWGAGGRVLAFANESGRQMTFRYAGRDSCASSDWTRYGFAAPAAQMLCSIGYPDGRESVIGYTIAGASPQIALIKDPGNEGQSWGWDTRGRLVSTRASLVTRVATFDPEVASLVARVAYDDEGRAAKAFEQPATAGATPIHHAMDFPTISEQDLRRWVGNPSAAAGAETSVQSDAGGQSLGSRVSIIDPTTLQPVSVSDAAGRKVSRNASRAVRSVVAPNGATTTYAYNDLGLVTKTVGPTTSGAGMTLSSTYDTERLNGDDKPLSGLRVQVYPRTGYSGTPGQEFWRADYTRGGLSASWSDRPSTISVQGSAVWTPDDDADARGAQDGWQFEVDRSGGAQVTLLIGATACAANPCVVKDLPKGPKPVTILVDEAGSQGWFSVSAAPVGDRLAPVSYSAVAPGYARVSVATSNDDLPGGPEGSEARYSYSDQALGLVSKASSVGGLAIGYGYEEANWRRQTSVTQPGGQVRTTSYWGDDETAALPQVCGGEVHAQSGQVRQIVRQDGVTVTTYYDQRGAVRAQVTEGESARETTCMTYSEAGYATETASFDASGVLIESSATTFDVGGDPRVTSTTITHGPAAPVDSGGTVTTVSTVDLAGRPILETGAGGEQTATEYDTAGNVSRRTITPPAGTGGAPLVFDYAYRSTDGALLTVRVNGTLAATAEYDSSGVLSSVAYAGGSTIAFGTLSNGRIGTVTVSTGMSERPRIQESREVSDYGRVVSTSMVATGTPRVEEDRAFTYDSAGRLARVTIAGDAGTTTFDYQLADQQSATCPAGGYAGAGKDGQRTGGARNGVAYVQCFDARGRLSSTTDPLITGGEGMSNIDYDGLGRVTRITGPRAASLTWSAGTQLARLVEVAADGTGLVDTRMAAYGGQIVDKRVATDAGVDRVRYAGPFVLGVDDTGVTGIRQVSYGLPGGANVTTRPGEHAVLTLPGLSGASLVSLEVPALGSGAQSAAGSTVELASRFGPYGEPLTVAEDAAADAAPVYAWQSAARQETLPGRASVTLMGQRPYHALLGSFLAPDPILDSGTNPFSYAGGDPINSHDATGQMSEDESSLVFIGAGIAGALLGGAVFYTGVLANIKKGVALGSFNTVSKWRIPTAKAVGGLAVVGGAGAVGYGTFVAVKSASDSTTTAALSAVGATILSVVGAGFAALPVYNRAGKLYSSRFSPAYSPTTIIKKYVQSRRAAAAATRSETVTEPLRDLIAVRSSTTDLAPEAMEILIPQSGQRSLLVVGNSTLRMNSFELLPNLRNSVGSLRSNRFSGGSSLALP